MNTKKNTKQISEISRKLFEIIKNEKEFSRYNLKAFFSILDYSNSFILMQQLIRNLEPLDFETCKRVFNVSRAFSSLHIEEIAKKEFEEAKSPEEKHEVLSNYQDAIKFSEKFEEMRSVLLDSNVESNSYISLEELKKYLSTLEKIF